MANRFFPNYKTYIITSPFGVRIHPVTKIKKQHNGIDLVATNDGEVGQVDDLIAHTGGIVESEGYDVSAGNFINIRVDEETVMVYYHMAKRTTLKKGQKVNKGDVLGRVGKTGTVTGAHLHFGIKKGGNWIDPAPYLDADYPVLQDVIIPDCPAGYTQQVFATVIVGALNVRKGPGTTYKAIKTLKKGTIVKILEVDGNWGRFADGWIDIKPAYVKIETKLNRLTANITLPILVRGDKSDTVKAAQELLMGKGYNLEGYGADRSFGGATERTVEAFQKKAGIPVTKVIDEATWKALLNIS